MNSESTQREVAVDCRYFKSDRPCSRHQQTGALCRCDQYQAIGDRVLIIKLDAMGDVLRSTALLPAIAEAHPNAFITWITRRESVTLVSGNPYVAGVIEHGADALLFLGTRAFDRVIKRDAGATSAEARRWFEMGGGPTTPRHAHSVL